MIKSAPMISSLKKLVPDPIKNIYHFSQALVGALIFLFPSKRLKIIGVTGTDGKTSTVHLIHHILGETGNKVSMLSTVEAKIGDKPLGTGLHVTTPDPFKIQSLLNKMAKAGSEYTVIETTSHGLSQNRVAFVNFLVGVVTNITHEHMDYHSSFRNYMEAKSKILLNVRWRVLNADDGSYKNLKDQGSGQLISFGINSKADYQAKNIEDNKKYIVFDLVYREKKKEVKVRVKTRLLGRYNIYNVLAAFVVCHNFGVMPEKIVKAIATFEGVSGRMQFINEGQRFDCIVDFAHTPASLQAALKALNAIKKGKIVAVLGSAGERDVKKRAYMGKIAAELADYTIFTTEDPRSEDPNKIIDQMSQGAVSAGGILNRTFWNITDRTEAIGTAIQTLAKDKDTVVIFGKGHERSMNIKGTEHPWSDEQVIRSFLKTKIGK